MRLTLLLFGFALFSCSGNDADKLFNQGANYLSRGILDSAFIYLSEAEQIYRSKENKGHVKIYLGSVMRRIGASNKALDYYLEAADLVKNNDRLLAACLKNSGRVLGELGNYSEGAKYINEALKLYEDDKLKNDALNTLGNIYIYAKNVNKAKKTYMYLLKNGYDSGKVYNNLGNLYMKANRDSSLYFLNLALKYKKDKSSTYAGLTKVGKLEYAKLVTGKYRADALRMSGDKDELIKELLNKIDEKEKIERLHNLQLIQNHIRLERHKKTNQIAVIIGGIFLIISGGLAVVMYLGKKERLKKLEENRRWAKDIAKKLLA